jgi:SsrA-binding protein
MPAPPDTPPDQDSRAAATTRKALRNYQVLEKYEAGIELKGTEVKSVRQGRVSLDEGFGKIDRGQVYLHGVHILPYEHGNVHNHDPRRPRRLLLHRREIKRLIGQVAEKGLTLVPLRLYFKRGYAKVQLGLCRGKQVRDRREDLRRKTAQREAERAIAARHRT